MLEVEDVSEIDVLDEEEVDSWLEVSAEVSSGSFGSPGLQSPPGGTPPTGTHGGEIHIGIGTTVGNVPEQVSSPICSDITSDLEESTNQTEQHDPSCFDLRSIVPAHARARQRSMSIKA